MEEIGRLATRIARGTEVPEDEQLIAKVARHVETVESTFSSDLTRAATSALHAGGLAGSVAHHKPNKQLLKYLRSPRGKLLHGIAMVQRAAKQLNLTPSHFEVEKHAKFLIELFPLGVELGTEVVIRTLQGCNINHKEKKNWVWDTNILYSAPHRPDRDGARTVVVTNDNDMLNAARKIAANYVISYRDYILDWSAALSKARR